jgi:hypothetical protein
VATTVPQPLRWVVLILIALVMLPIVAMSLAVAAIAWMPLTAALGAVAIWLLMRWNVSSSGRGSGVDSAG